MQKLLSLLISCAISASCVSNHNDAEPVAASAFTVLASPVATVTVIGADTLSDSARIHHLAPEPDGGSIAFLFADPAKGITRGLGISQTSASQVPQLAWPDSVISVWWSNPHQLSFTAGTGQGVHVVVNSHAAQLEALAVTGTQSTPVSAGSVSTQSNTSALSRAQAFIDSVRVQPEGTPQRSGLHYQADSVIVAPGDTLAAVHVLAADASGMNTNPAWYLIHIPTGHVQAIDSLIGASTGLPASAGQWSADGSFYYAKERSIWRAQANAK
jgi:hypothetical protein